jgi:very-short-patch-repair endonuclease
MPAESAKKHILSRTRDGDRDIADLARSQHGVVGRIQLMELGVGRRAIAARLRSGRLHRIHAGVYAVGHTVLSREGRWMAAVLASGPDVALSHWSAAALWGIRLNSRTRVDVTVPHATRSSAAIRRHVSDVPTDERTVVEGIPVTSVPRTVLDLAATQPAAVVEAMLREVEFRQLWDRLSLADLVDRYPGRRGVRKVRQALELVRDVPAGRFRSPLEERFAVFLDRNRLPRPLFNDWIALGERRFQVDCHWPKGKLLIELDGWQAHGGRRAFRRDRQRDRLLAAAGYTVVRITSAQLEDEPERLAADLRALFRHRAQAE